jgi:hypothetical protein
MLTIELENGPRVAIERVGVDAFAAAVQAALMGQKIDELPLTTKSNSSIPEPEPSPTLKRRDGLPARPPRETDHGARSRQARDVAIPVLADGNWHQKAELNGAWRAAGLTLSLAGRAMSSHVEKRMVDGRSEWRLDPGSELWDDLIVDAPKSELAHHGVVAANGHAGAR